MSHHTGANFQTDKLEAIVIRFVKEDLANLSDLPLSMDEDYFEASKIPDEERDATMDKLFEEALKNLTDYSTFQVAKDTPAAVLPLVPNAPDLASNAEYFGERLLSSAVKTKVFKLVERKSLQSVLEELELQLSGTGGREGRRPGRGTPGRRGPGDRLGLPPGRKVRDLPAPGPGLHRRGAVRDPGPGGREAGAVTERFPEITTEFTESTEV
ncbi:MAG: hypothetical protein MZV70_69800 [Desulfobacterales bacterium]|nr:hypothetical protein [Desulfobacterales bacterium]